MLSKIDGTDYNTQWSASSGGVTQSYVDTQDNLRVLKAGDTLTGNLTVPAGAVGTPALNFTGGTTTGLFYTASTLNFAVGGALKLAIGASSVVLSNAVPLRAYDGTQAIPSISFSSETSSGLFRKAGGSISVSAVNNEVMNWVGSTKTTTAYGPIIAQGPVDLITQTVTQAGANLSINRTLGENCALSLTASITAVTVTNWPASGTTGKVRLIVSNTGAFAISGWPAGTIWPGGTAPVITSGAGKKDIILLMSDNAGAAIYGSVVGQDYR